MPYSATTARFPLKDDEVVVEAQHRRLWRYIMYCSAHLLPIASFCTVATVSLFGQAAHGEVGLEVWWHGLVLKSGRHGHEYVVPG